MSKVPVTPNRHFVKKALLQTAAFLSVFPQAFGSPQARIAAPPALPNPLPTLSLGLAGQQNQTSLIQIPQEVQMGKKAAEQIRTQSNLLISGPEYDRMARVRKQLLPTMKAQYKAENGANIDFNITIIDDPKQINAFALPSGDIFIYSGLLKLIDPKDPQGDDKLANILGHEMTHVTKRHYAKLTDKNATLKSWTDLLIGITKANNSQVLATQVGVLLQQLKYSRAMETEADREGQANALAVGYQPAAMADFFVIMDKNTSKSGPSWLSNHPDTGRRVTEARQWAAANTISVEDPFAQPAPASAPTLKQIFGVPQ